MLKKYFLVITTFFLFVFGANGAEINNTDSKKVPDPKNTLYIELKDGVVIAELFPNVAPMHVQRIRTLTKDGFYDGLKFHRVINSFMAQTGDPSGTGRGGSKLGKLYAEFNNEHHIRGTLSMARASDPNSANSQFFIVTGEFFPELDGQYTVFGRVIEGMQYVDKIKAGDTAKNGVVDNPDTMIKVLTGDMLNNKQMNTVKEEIKIVSDMQNEKIKADSNYKKQSILGLLLQAKDININETDQKDEVNTTANPMQNNNQVTSNNSGINNTNVAPVVINNGVNSGNLNTSVQNNNTQNGTGNNAVATPVTVNNANNSSNLNMDTQNNNVQNGINNTTNNVPQGI